MPKHRPGFDVAIALLERRVIGERWRLMIAALNAIEHDRPTKGAVGPFVALYPRRVIGMAMRQLFDRLGGAAVPVPPMRTSTPGWKRGAAAAAVG